MNEYWEKAIKRMAWLEREIERLKVLEVPGLWQAWTPTYGGFSVNPSDVTSRYCVMGKVCFATAYMLTNGTSNANTFTVSAPVAAGSGTHGASLIFYVDGGVASYGIGFVRIESSGTSFILGNSSGVGGWNTSGGKRAGFSLWYEV